MAADGAPDRGPLLMWVIYDRPTDFPESYVARLWAALPRPEPLSDVLVCDDLEALRDHCIGLGGVRLERQPDDDPTILETWLV